MMGTKKMSGKARNIMKLGFIGGGNMAFAIAGGVLTAELCTEQEIFISDPNPEALKKFRELQISADTSNENALQADYIILAVKPFILPTVLAELKEKYAESIREKVFISIAAGVDIASIKESTLRYHNQNIYGKLGVNSLKQLLRYAALMNQETASNESEEKN